MRRLIASRAFFLVLLAPAIVLAGAQKHEPMSASIQTAMSRSISDQAPRESSFKDVLEGVDWMTEMSLRLMKHIPEREARFELLSSVHYEATRAGLDPQLVLGLIQVESMFKNHLVSPAGARGLMQVMPFWIKAIGRPDDDLFHLRTNLRYGCTILRHYLNIEKGDLYRALGRYNGSLGYAAYPNRVKNIWHSDWMYTRKRSSANAPARPH